LSSSIHSTAAAPSEICDEVPAVWMPSSRTGFSEASPGLLGLALRVEAELVDLLAGDAAALGDPFGRGELVGQVDVPR
jgi:hypothetical protein